jgi:hypothetical protein
MKQMAVVTEKDHIIGDVGSAFGLRHDVVIFKAAMIALLRLWSATAQATFEPVPKINLKTGAVGKRHLPKNKRL